MNDWKRYTRLYEGEKEDSLLFRVRLCPAAGEFRVLYIQLLVRNAFSRQDGLWDNLRRLVQLSTTNLKIESDLGFDSGSLPCH